MQRQHEIFPDINREEASLFDFAVTFKEQLSGRLSAKLRETCLAEAKAQGEDLEQAPPDAWPVVASRFNGDARVKFWSALKRAHQEFYVDATAACVDRQLPELVKRFRQITEDPVLGSLELDPSVKVPDYQSTVDIHCVPGGYALERLSDDIYPGARSDLGGAIYAMRRHGALHEDKGVTGARYVKERFPNFVPSKILDLGCTAGNSTLPYVDNFPEADIHAVDVSAPCLRYAHARAEALKKKVHFSQQNAESTRFADNTFDLVVSHILLHETSVGGLTRILKECRRLLKPDGVMLHVEVPVKARNALDQYFMNWDAFYNNEPFWATLAALDFAKLACDAGFRPEDVIEENVPSQRRKKDGWLVLGAQTQGDRQ